MVKKILNILKKEKTLITILVCIGICSHGFNVFSYPSYFDDEGTYMAQAWAVLQGKLSPYTYWYDHSPLGWIQIAIWLFFTGGINTFGTSINSGRVFMILVHAVATVFVYVIAKQTTTSKKAGVLASLIFSLSPLAVSLQRMVFLDSISTLWLLCSMYMLTKAPLKLRHIVVSGITLAMSVLVKESTAFVMPAVFIGLLLQIRKEHRNFGVTLFMLMTGIVITFYPLFALLKGEFFAEGSTWGPEYPHVSLLTTLSWQSNRSGGYFLSDSSEFLYSLKNSWFPTDPYLITIGFFGTFVTFVAGVTRLLWAWRKKKHSYIASLEIMISLIIFSYIGYLIRGGIINDQYIIPLIPLFALTTSIFVAIIERWLTHIPYIKRLAFIPFCIGLFVFGSLYIQKLDPYFYNQTKAQIDAIAWATSERDPSSILAIDGFALADLMPKTGDIYQTAGAHHYWKLDQDPTLKKNLLGDSWKEIDYAMITNKFNRDKAGGELPLTSMIVGQGDLIKTFTNPRSWYESNRRYGFPYDGHILIADSGPTYIYARPTTEILSLRESWNFYTSNFIHGYGQVIDPSNNRTTSEGQSYAMLRAVYMNDKAVFDGAWSWTKDHLRYRPSDKLISWLWQHDEQGGKLLEWTTATDADTDMAYALLLASKQFNNPEYLAEAKVLITDIWNVETATIAGKRVITAGDWAAKPENTQFTLNPSYFAPYAYKVFAEVDPEHNWNEVVDTSYEYLDKCTRLSPVNLTPDWCTVDVFGNVDIAASTKVNFSYDAFRTYFRIGLDWKLTQEPRAKQYFENATFFSHFWNTNKKITDGYTPWGTPLSTYEAPSFYGGLLPYASIVDELHPKSDSMVSSIYKEKIQPLFQDTETQGYWGNKDNYYDQNWVWFGMAFANDQLKNIWK